MESTTSFSGIDAVILCGGQGTRLRAAISDRPKVLAPFGDVTFLDILIETLKKAGFHHVILCTGYMKEQITRQFQLRRDISVSFSEESEPLGTGGALKNAQSKIRSSTFVVLNGDSICDIRYRDFLRFHRDQGALISMALVEKTETGDFGSVTVDASFGITSFKEKVAHGNRGLVNAGIYVMEKEIFSFFPEQVRFSLENDLFPGLSGERCAALSSLVN